MRSCAPRSTKCGWALPKAEFPCAAKVIVGASAAAGIIDQADSFAPDLIVIAAHGRSGVERLLLGSTAEKVIRHSACEVLVVRGR